MSKCTEQPPAFPWSVAELGWEILRLDEAQHVFDVQSLAARSENPPLKVHYAEAAGKWAYARRNALRELALTMQGKTLGDAVLHGVFAIELVEGLEFASEPEMDAFSNVKRAVLSMMVVCAAAEGIDLARCDLGSGYYDRQLRVLFPTTGGAA